MPRNFNWNVWPPNNPAALMRLGLGRFRRRTWWPDISCCARSEDPPAELRQQATEMRAQIRQQQNALEQMRALAGKIEIGRGEGNSFMSRILCPAAPPTQSSWLS